MANESRAGLSRNWKSGLVGFTLGLMTAMALNAAAAQLVGRDGYLDGWTVTKDGDDICDDPYIWKSTKEIECD